MIRKLDSADPCQIRWNVRAPFVDEAHTRAAEPTIEPTEFKQDIGTCLAVACFRLSDQIIRSQEDESKRTTSSLILKFFDN